MSTTVISQGFIAMLLTPVEKDALEELSENLYDEKSSLKINYGGTLLISDNYRTKKYSEREFNGDLFIIGDQEAGDRAQFIQEATLRGLLINPDTIQPYTCVWYNGSDSPVSMLTLDEFLNKES